MCAATIVLSINACRSKRQIPANNTTTAQEISGIYTGTLSCADCPGIQTRVDINADLTYTLQIRYIDKSEEALTSSGKFEWNAGNKIVTFDNQLLGKCLFEGTTLHVLVDGKKYMGQNTENYMLTKSDQNLVEKYWKLIELYGNPITSANNSKEAHVTFHIEGNRFSGDVGCNRVMGSYQTKEHNRIALSAVATTMMMCLDMENEIKFLQALEMVDNYSIQNDTLSLNRARMAPLARFVVVYQR